MTIKKKLTGIFSFLTTLAMCLCALPVQVSASDVLLTASNNDGYTVTFEASIEIWDDEDNCTILEDETLPKTMTVNSEGKLDSIPVPVIEGWTFLEWNIYPEDSWDVITVDEDTVFTADTTVYAQYIEGILIICDANGAIFWDDTTETYLGTARAMEDGLPQSSIIPPKGKLFLQWTTNPDGTGQVYKDIYVDETGKFLISPEITKETTLYAQYVDEDIIESVEITGETLDIKAGDAPKFTGTYVAKGYEGKYGLYAMWAEYAENENGELEPTGRVISSLESQNRGFEALSEWGFSLLTEYKEGYTYKLTVYGMASDSMRAAYFYQSEEDDTRLELGLKYETPAMFADDVTLTINGQAVTKDIQLDKMVISGYYNLDSEEPMEKALSLYVPDAYVITAKSASFLGSAFSKPNVFFIIAGVVILAAVIVFFIVRGKKKAA